MLSIEDSKYYVYTMLSTEDSKYVYTMLSTEDSAVY